MLSTALLMFIEGDHAAGAHPSLTPSPPEVVEQAAEPAILFEHLGGETHPITTGSELAQRYFDQGLALTYAFNHGEAIRSFEEAARLDPRCAMAHWGVALAYGPNINRAMPDAAAQEAYRAIERARALAEHVSERERDYIEALAVRYEPAPSKDRAALDEAYADAMRRLSARDPRDPDAATLFAAALLNVDPWRWWAGGRPTPETQEAIGVLERVIAQRPGHIGASHYHIHALETGPEVDRALPSADRLHALAPEAGHLLHMPSHVYLRLGRYHESAIANARGGQADRAYARLRGYDQYYVQHYYPHNASWLVFATLMEGRSEASAAAADAIAAEVEAGNVRTEELRALPLFVRTRFGRWDEILAEREVGEGASSAVALAWHYARGMAHAARGDVAAARRDAAKVDELATEAPAGRVAEAVLEGAIARAEGRTEDAIASLTDAVARAEPMPLVPLPHWYYPVRQSLGAALLEAGRAAEAEAVYERDLKEYPDNGWSLFGLARSLHAQGRDADAEAAWRRFERAWRHADVALADSSVPR